MELFAFAVLVGLIPAVIAHNKGRSFFAWWLYGALISIVAIPHSLLIKKTTAIQEEELLFEGNKKCPYCAEIIKPEALVCRYCGREVANIAGDTVLPAYDVKSLKSVDKTDNNNKILSYCSYKNRHRTAYIATFIVIILVGSLFYFGISDSINKEKQAAVEISRIKEAIENGEGIHAKILYASLIDSNNPLSKTKNVRKASYLEDEIEKTIQRENGTESTNAIF